MLYCSKLFNQTEASVLDAIRSEIQRQAKLIEEGNFEIRISNLSAELGELTEEHEKYNSNFVPSTMVLLNP